jgi:hypothetical protein
MNVTDFLCVSLGSSTVQLHDAQAHVQRLVSILKNGDRDWGVYYRRAHPAVSFFFLWAKGLNTKDIHKDIFPVYGGKCLSPKAIHNCVENFSQERSKVADALPGRPVEIATEVTGLRSPEIYCIIFLIGIVGGCSPIGSTRHCGLLC